MLLNDVIKRYSPPFEPLPYQVDSINLMLPFDKVLLDGPVGCGKTFLSTYLALCKEADQVLILIPPILGVQWRRWLDSLNVGEVTLWQGTVSQRKELNLRAKWVISSYGLFKNDYDQIRRYLHDDAFIIVDEAQNLKSSSSQIYRKTRDIAVGRSLLLMTGTPLSSPSDAFAYIKLRRPDIYRSLRHFENTHVEERDFFGQVTKWKELDLLTKNFRLNCVYITKELVSSQNPKAVYMPLRYQLSRAHMKLYKRLLDEQLLEVGEGKIDATTANALYHASQQVIVNLPHFSGDPDVKSEALAVIDEVCDEIDVGSQTSSKLIIWTMYKLTSRLVLAYLKKYNPAGAYSEVDSKAGVEKFMNDPTCRILVANPLSAGMGLNAQHVCYQMLFLECPTRTILFEQSAGRIDRLGQTQTPIIRIAIAEGTIQEYLHKRLMENDKLVQRVLNTGRDLRKVIYGG